MAIESFFMFCDDYSVYCFWKFKILLDLVIILVYKPKAHLWLSSLIEFLKYKITSFNSVNTSTIFDMFTPSNICVPPLNMIKFIEPA